MNNTLTELLATRVCLSKALEKVNALIEQEEKKMESTKTVIQAELYIFPEPTQIFERTQSFCVNAEKRGNVLGIRYHEETPLVRVLFSTPGEDKRSWNDHSLPEELVSGLDLDPDKRYYAPGYVPLSLVAGKANGDQVVLDLTDKLKIVCTLTGGSHDSFQSVLYDDLQAMIPLYRDLFENTNIIDKERARYAYNIGLCYENGWGCLKDEERAHTWFKNSAHLGSKRAEWRIGVA